MTFDSYQSPFSWRYASPEMRSIWSENNKRLLWRRIWVCLAETQAEYGLVTPEQVADLQTHAAALNISRALEIEAEIKHDLMAEVRAFAEQCPVGGGIIHLGATSMDVKDNAEALQVFQALQLVSTRLRTLLRSLAQKIEQYAAEPCIAFTHLQPAEPTTLGYRLANYAQDLLEDWEGVNHELTHLRGKGFKGAVGTGASYMALLGGEQFTHFENQLSQRLGLPFFEVATQTYPRRQDYQVISTLSGLGASLYKLSIDLRLLQSQPIGELSEPFGAKQVGSSAMPFKRNPVKLEQISSLARSLSQMPQLAWQNAAHSLLERTLDDSANRRTLLPEAFLTVDEILIASTRVVEGLVVNKNAMRRNLSTYAPFAASEPLLMALVKAGANRQEMHELLRQHAMNAWAALENGQPNPLNENILQDPVICGFLAPEIIKSLMNVENYLGFAPQRALLIAQHILEKV